MVSTMTYNYQFNWLTSQTKEELEHAIQARILELEENSDSYRAWSIALQAGSFVGLPITVGAASLLPWFAPIGGFWFGGILLYSLIRDFMFTGNPSVFELLLSISKADRENAPIKQKANFLPIKDGKEYAFLKLHTEELVDFLIEYPEEKRPNKYLLKLGQFSDGRLTWPAKKSNFDFEELIRQHTYIQTEPTYIQQTRLPQAPPKVNRAHAVEVITPQLPPAKPTQQAPTVIQDDLLYRPNTDPTMVTDNLPVYEEFSTEIQNHDLLPQFRDLAKEIANYVGHIGLVAKTQSGKTTLLIGSVLEAVAAGHQVILIDGKGDARLRALGQIQNVQYLHCNTSDKVANLYAVVDRLLNVLVERQDNENAPMHPITLICDEYNMIRDAVSDEGATPAEGAKILFAFDKKMKKFVLQGAAAKIFFRGSNHTSRIEDWGWNTGVLDSLSFLALGRGHAYESIEDLLRFQITNAKPFQILLEDYRKVEFEEPLALTTLKPLGFCRIPFVDYESQKPSKPKEQWLGTVRKVDEPQEQEEDLSDLTEDELAVYQFVKNKGGFVLARPVSQGKLKSLVEGGNNKAPYIRKIFTSLYDKGLGEIRGEEGSMEFRAN